MDSKIIDKQLREMKINDYVECIYSLNGGRETKSECDLIKIDWDKREILLKSKIYEGHISIIKIDDIRSFKFKNIHGAVPSDTSGLRVSGVATGPKG